MVWAWFEGVLLAILFLRRRFFVMRRGPPGACAGRVSLLMLSMGTGYITNEISRSRPVSVCRPVLRTQEGILLLDIIEIQGITLAPTQGILIKLRKVSSTHKGSFSFIFNWGERAIPWLVHHYFLFSFVFSSSM